MAALDLTRLVRGLTVPPGRFKRYRYTVLKGTLHVLGGDTAGPEGEDLPVRMGRVLTSTHSAVTQAAVAARIDQAIGVLSAVGSVVALQGPWPARHVQHAARKMCNMQHPCVQHTICHSTGNSVVAGMANMAWLHKGATLLELFPLSVMRPL